MAIIKAAKVKFLQNKHSDSTGYTPPAIGALTSSDTGALVSYLNLGNGWHFPFPNAYTNDGGRIGIKIRRGQERLYIFQENFKLKLTNCRQCDKINM